MPAGPSMAVEQYLHTSFEYDAEYVAGKVLYRVWPDRSHSEVQGFLLWSVHNCGRKLGFRSWPSIRVQTQADPPRYRVPDVCVTLGEPDEEIFTAPPFICIEILTPEDCVMELSVKIEEYLDFGVQYVWVIDSRSHTGEIYTRSGIERIRDGKFRAGAILVDLNELEP
jgi:Uma2 family endonuclease